MKKNSVLKKENSNATRCFGFVKTEKPARAERKGRNPQTGEELVIEAQEAKPATPIITVSERNQISFNKEVVALYNLQGKTLTIANVEGTHYLVLTANNEVSGLTFINKDGSNADSKKFTASEFVKELRNVENGWSNNFVLEEVSVEVPFVSQVEKVFICKLNVKPAPVKVKKERVKK
jgi:hypothetical protein